MSWFFGSSRAGVPARAAESAEARHAAQIAELTASRRHVAEAYERERRRIERDLHDGAQQYFVAAVMALGEARYINQDPKVDEVLGRTEELLQSGIENLRHTVHGIHPQVLVDAGLEAAVRDSARSFGGNVTVRCPHPLPDLDAAVLASAYFFTSEALTNAAKYAPGAPVTVLLTADQFLTISVVDQGPGGATFREGGGLSEMRNRIEAFDGSLSVHSPAGGPTQVVAKIPMMLHRGETGIGDHRRLES